MIKNEYKSVFKIKYGARRNFGYTYDEETTDIKIFTAPNDFEAFMEAYRYAEMLSMEYLTGRDGKTKVTIINLEKPNGGEVDQIEQARNLVEKIFKKYENNPKILEGLCSREEYERQIAEELPGGKLVLFTTDLEQMLDSIGKKE